MPAPEPLRNPVVPGDPEKRLEAPQEAEGKPTGGPRPQPGAQARPQAAGPRAQGAQGQRPRPAQAQPGPGARQPAAETAQPSETAPPPEAPARPAPQRAQKPVAPAVGRSRARRRHVLVMLSFLLLVVAPAGVAAWYLWTKATDQYASTVAFSVRREEVTSAVEILGGITDFSGSSSSDPDILYEFLQSQQLVTEMDDELDLRAIWSKPDDDPVFAYGGSSIEDLVDYWKRMVRVYYDSGTGLIEVRVLAFDPEDAHRIAIALFDKSADMINELSDAAREDAIRYSREELATAVERLKEARLAVTAFRNRNQMVDPNVDIQAQAGLLGTLQTQLAEALIESDLLRETTRANDPRIAQAQLRIQVIEDRIAAERRKLGLGAGADDGEAFADVFGEYERLAVDREFAEQSYTSALAAYDSSLAEARRKSRYLAAHVQPTVAQSARYPERVLLLGFTALFLFLAWAILVLVAYSVKDRR